MKLLALILLLSVAAQFFLPWWIVGLISFGACWWHSESGGRAFLVGFAGIGLSWLLYALLIHLQTGGILTSRMSQLIVRQDGSVFILALTTLVGGLVGGVSGLAGHQVRQVFRLKA